MAHPDINNFLQFYVVVRKNWPNNGLALSPLGVDDATMGNPKYFPAEFKYKQPNMFTCAKVS